MALKQAFIDKYMNLMQKKWLKTKVLANFLFVDNLN